MVMRFWGCGCLMMLLVVAALGFALGYAAVRLDIIYAVPHKPAASVVAQRPSFLLRIDPNRPQMLDALSWSHEGAPAAIFKWWLPYEVLLAADTSGGSEGCTMTLSASLRRFGRLLELVRSQPEHWKWFSGQEVNNVSLVDDSLWVVRSALKCPPSLELAGPGPRGAPLELEEGHFFELLLDNRRRGAQNVLQSLLGSDVTASEAVNLLRRLTGALGAVASARCWADFDGDDTLIVSMRGVCWDTASAEQCRALLEAERGKLTELLAQQQVKFDGSLTYEEAEVLGRFTLEGAAHALARKIRFRGV